MCKVIVALLVLLGPAAGWADEPAPGDSTSQLDRLIVQLGDPDPRQREAAGREILALGREARDALEEARHWPIPEIADRAAVLIQKLPWDATTDPQAVRGMLSTYGNQTAFGRKRIISQIAMMGLDDNTTSAILVRILLNETSEPVRWHASAAIRGLNDHTWAMQLLRRARLERRDSVAVLATGVWACAVLDPPRARALAERADGMLRKGDDPAALDFLYELGVGLEVAAGRYERAAAMCRRWDTLRPPVPEGETTVPPIDGLFMLHGRFGPLEGFGSDLIRSWAHLADAPVLYGLGLAAARREGAVAGKPFYAAAWMVNGLSQQGHWQAANILFGQREYALAKRELNAVLWLGSADPDSVRLRCSAHLRLATIAGREKNDLAYGQHVEAALAMIDAPASGLALQPAKRRAIEAWMNWHFLLAAQGTRNDGEVQQRLERLGQLSPLPADLVLEVVPFLKRSMRSSQAHTFFEQAYREKQAALEAADVPRNKNALAWLCVRCGERLDEALKLAEQAVRAEPDNAAYLDTAAEAHFRLGHREKAIELESRAAELAPGDSFLKEQLERFRNGDDAGN